MVVVLLLVGHVAIYSITFIGLPHPTSRPKRSEVAGSSVGGGCAGIPVGERVPAPGPSAPMTPLGKSTITNCLSKALDQSSGALESINAESQAVRDGMGDQPSGGLSDAQCAVQHRTSSPCPCCGFGRSSGSLNSKRTGAVSGRA